ncbi:MAG: phytanoyl-CoA dioxygenase family protein [Phycisphaerales bacterium]
MQSTSRQSADRPYNIAVDAAANRQLRALEKRLPLRVLSASDFAFWQTNGYVVVPGALPPEAVRRTVDFLWDFQEMDPDDKSSWERPQRRDIKMAELNNGGMVEAYNHPALWSNRQERRVYDAFVDIWDREDLWVTIDRANLNTPNRGVRAFDGFIHWDVDTTIEPPPIGVQGVVSLVDTDAQTGGFQCVPEIFRDFDAWKRGQPADRDGWRPDLGGLEPTFVPLRAGDLLIWNSLLAHGIRANRSDRPRIAQYIAMLPADEGNQALRDWRIRSWRERLAPEGDAFPGDPRDWERSRYPTAPLTPLGERLLGLKSWRDPD